MCRKYSKSFGKDAQKLAKTFEKNVHNKYSLRKNNAVCAFLEEIVGLVL